MSGYVQITHAEAGLSVAVPEEAAGHYASAGWEIGGPAHPPPPPSGRSPVTEMPALTGAYHPATGLYADLAPSALDMMRAGGWMSAQEWREQEQARIEAEERARVEAEHAAAAASTDEAAPDPAPARPRTRTQGSSEDQEK